MTLFKINSRRFRLTILVASLLSSVTSSALSKEADSFQPKVLAYTNANILDPSIELPISQATIVVSNGQIIKIQPDSTPISASVEQVDLKGKWVVPGLIDGHVHLAESGGAFARPDIVDARKIRSYEDEQAQLIKNQQKILNRYLRLGITSIFDLGGPTEYLTKYHQLANDKNAPEIYFAGALLSPKDVPSLNADGATFAKVTTSADAIKLAKQQISKGTHILKVVWTHETGISSEQLLNLYQPAILYAKSQGLAVAIHVEELEAAKWAVKSGADILVHGVMREDIDDELIAMMLANGVTYSPTLTAFQHYFEFFKGDLSFNEFEVKNALTDTLNSFDLLNHESNKVGQMFHILKKYLPMVDKNKETLAKLAPQEQSIIKQLKTTFSKTFFTMQKSNLKKVISAGVNVSLGSDAGNIGTLHGSALLGEMQAWHAAGISNKDIIKAATLGNALALKQEHSIGSLSSNKKANFVVLNNNPYKDLSTLKNPIQVYKNGAPVLVSREK